MEAGRSELATLWSERVPDGKTPSLTLLDVIRPIGDQS